jgi:1,4-dihydroxy-2-naphthoate octaprenyltransferase
MILCPAAVAYRASPAHTLTLSTFLLSLVGGLSIHAFGNIVNTYVDFARGLDRQENQADDRAIVDGSVTPRQVQCIALACLLSGIAATVALAGHVAGLPADSSSAFSPLSNFLLLVLLGTFLAYSYTGWPLYLKYRRLGDVAIFLCFGPLLVEGAFFVHTGRLSLEALMYSIPLGLLTENILHANNARDIDIDLAAGAMTLANTIGFAASYKVFQALYLAAFAMLPMFVFHWYPVSGLRAFAFLLPCLMLGPLGDVLQAFRSHDKQAREGLRKKRDGGGAALTEPAWDICDRCGKFSFGFGVLLAVAILIGR